jgi:hypothetical protein
MNLVLKVLVVYQIVFSAIHTFLFNMKWFSFKGTSNIITNATDSAHIKSNSNMHQETYC